MFSLFDCSVVALDVIYENQLVINFVVFGGDQETSCQINRLSASIQLLDLLIDTIIHKEAIHELNCNISRSISLFELLCHTQYSAHEVLSVFQILKTDFVFILGHFFVFQMLVTTILIAFTFEHKVKLVHR